MLLHRALDRAHEDLHALVTRTLPGLDYGDRRTEIARYVHGTRRALAQLLVLLEWQAGQGGAMRAAEDCTHFLRAEAEQGRAVLDRLFYAHRDLFRKQVASRPYDLTTALDVLAVGTTVARFPRELDLATAPTSASDKKNFSVQELNHAIHSSLIIREQVPTQYSHAHVEDGVLRLVDAAQFALCLTLESADPSCAPWRLLDLQFLLPAQGGHDSSGNAFHVLEPDMRQRKQVFDMLRPVLENDPEPLLGTFKLCRSLCNAMRLEMLALQAKELAKSHWEGHLHVDDAAAGQLDLTFWKSVALGAEQPGGNNDATVEDPLTAEDKKPLACRIRAWLVEEEGLQNMRARCSYEAAAGNGASKEVAFRLSINRAHVSASDLLWEAFRVLVLRRLQFLQDQLEGDPAVQALVTKGALKMARPASQLELEVWGSRLDVGVDCKSGCFLVLMPSCSGVPASEELTGLLDEWQAAIAGTGGSNLGNVSLGLSRRLFHGIVRQFFLRRLEVVARTHYDLTCNQRWHALQPFNLRRTVQEEEEKKQNGEKQEAEGIDEAAAQNSSALRANCSTYFLLSTRSGAGEDEGNLQGWLSFGEEWAFLEVEVSERAVPEQPTVCAYLVVASLARRSKRVPTMRSRQRLLSLEDAVHVPHDVWLGKVLAMAKEMMRARFVLDAVARALGIAPAVEGRVVEAVAKESQMVDMDVRGARAAEKGLSTLSVERGGEEKWTWHVGLPVLEARGRPTPQANKNFSKHEGGRTFGCTYRGPPGLVELTFEGAWDALVLAQHLSEAVGAVVQFSGIAAEFVADAHPQFALADNGNGAGGGGCTSSRLCTPRAVARHLFATPSLTLLSCPPREGAVFP